MTSETARLVDETIARLIEETSRLTQQGPQGAAWVPFVLTGLAVGLGAALVLLVR